MDEKVISNVSDLTPIADALRATTGGTQTYSIPELTVAAVNAISSGGGSVAIDTTLTQSGQAADAAVVGSALESKADIDYVASQISTAVATKADSEHTHSTYVNQNAFSNVKVGTTTVAADSTTDTLTLVAGSNVTITPDATNDKITIAATDTIYTHPSYTARTGVPTANQTPAFGGTFSVSQPVSDATGHITAVNSRTITIPNTAATQSAAGLMSADDKKKLDGIATGANKITVDSALSSTSTNPVQNKVVNTAISNLNTLVGDASVATQITNAVATKADLSEGAIFIQGSGTTDSTAKTSTWVGTSDKITSYYDGLTIRYKIGVAGQTTTTLNINGLGAKTVYRFSDSKLTTHFPVNSIIHLIYHADLNSGCWMCSDYDANTNTYQRVYSSTNNVEYPITTRYATTTGNSYYAEYGRYSTGVTLNPSTKTITATAFKGKLTGNADTATKATQDASGNVITSTYATKAELEAALDFATDEEILTMMIEEGAFPVVYTEDGSVLCSAENEILMI